MEYTKYASPHEKNFVLNTKEGEMEVNKYNKKQHISNVVFIMTDMSTQAITQHNDVVKIFGTMISAMDTMIEHIVSSKNSKNVPPSG